MELCHKTNDYYSYFIIIFYNIKKTNYYTVFFGIKKGLISLNLWYLDHHFLVQKTSGVQHFILNTRSRHLS